MAEPLGVGLIGFGYIGKVHAYGYRTMPLFYDPLPAPTRLVGVAACRPAGGRPSKGFRFRHSRLAGAIDRRDIHIVISAPRTTCTERPCDHRRRQAYYCDKPLVVTAEEYPRGRALAVPRDQQMTLQYRFPPLPAPRTGAEVPGA